MTWSVRFSKLVSQHSPWVSFCHTIQSLYDTLKYKNIWRESLTYVETHMTTSLLSSCAQKPTVGKAQIQREPDRRNPFVFLILAVVDMKGEGNRQLCLFYNSHSLELAAANRFSWTDKQVICLFKQRIQSLEAWRLWSHV